MANQSAIGEASFWNIGVDLSFVVGFVDDKFFGRGLIGVLMRV